MKILVTGAGGQLGSDVMLRLGRLGIEAVGTDASALDITEPPSTLFLTVRDRTALSTAPHTRTSILRRRSARNAAA